MLNDIIDGISTNLNLAFGDEYEIYSENVEQGLTEPCFFIATLDSEFIQGLGTRQQRKYFFDIHYFPRNTEFKKQEMNSVLDDLMSYLEYITLLNGDMLRGTDINGEIVDDVLHFFITYKVNLDKVAEKTDNMEILDLEQKVKEG